MTSKRNLKRNLVLVYILVFSLAYLFAVLELSSASSYGEKIVRDNYVISRSKIQRLVGLGEVFKEYISIKNNGQGTMNVKASFDDSIATVLDLNEAGVIVGPGNTSELSFFIKGREIGNYTGKIYLKGDVSEEIPVNISVLSEGSENLFLIESNLDKETFVLGKDMSFKLNIYMLKHKNPKNVSILYQIREGNGSVYFLGNESLSLSSSVQIVKKFQVPETLKTGQHLLEITLNYDDRSIFYESPFNLRKSFFKILIFGFLPMWVVLLFILILVSIFLAYYVYKKIEESKKKYKMDLDIKTIPKKSPGFFNLGKIAEKNSPAYLDPGKLTTHCIVAGATGGGKSISAQVIVEEALLNNVAVIVFDPTAQWSGMLRKCEDKKMLSFYPKFGMKESDAKAFKGNIRQVKNAREVIDVRKYMNPGQIQIFTLNKLDPKDIDIFVANVIRQVFRSDPKEEPNLKLLLVFDEVHRLLSKFGGSGEGFLQVERACREFRKWGMGVMLVSQVLSDFVGEIKANISTEVQMRTRDEGDLERIKTKYGEGFLQSLVKASVGAGMFVNPSYNHARPYFINFRPILHNTRRLSDEELDKYNKYNEIIDDLEYQIEQLEENKVDVFDLKMELKLVKDKLMVGNFSVVDIYLEGLNPRIEKEWDKLGKKPKKRQIELVSEEEIKNSIQEAKKEREKFEEEEKKKDAGEKEEKEETKVPEKKEEKEESKEEGEEKSEEEENSRSDKGSDSSKKETQKSPKSPASKTIKEAKDLLNKLEEPVKDGKESKE